MTQYGQDFQPERKSLRHGFAGGAVHHGFATFATFLHSSA